MRADYDLERLYVYFENSLKYLSEEGGLFSRKYGTNINLLESKDHDVQRLIEAFAMFDARLTLLANSQHEQQARMILSMIAPEVLTQRPCCAIVQLKSPNRDQVVFIEKNKSVYVQSDTEVFTFTTCDEISLTTISINSVNTVSLNKYSEIEEVNGLEIEVYINAYTDRIRIYINAEENFTNGLVMAMLCNNNSLFIRDQSLNSLRRIGRVVPYYPLLTESSLCGYSLQTLYDYTISPNAFYFVDLIFEVKLDTRSKLDLILPLSNNIELNFNILNKNMFLLNCIPIINLFHKRSEPIIINHADEKSIILADINDQYRINKVLNIHHNENILSTGNDYLIDYDNITNLFLRNRFTYPNRTIMYSSILCTNNRNVFGISAGAKCIFDRLNFLESTIVKIEDQNSQSQINYWSLLQLYTTADFLKQNNLMEYVNLASQVYNLKSCIKSINIVESIGIRSNAWKGLFNKLILEINMKSDSKTILLLIWAQIFKNQGNFSAMVEVHIIKNNNVIFVL